MKLALPTVLGAGTFYSRWIMKNVMPQDGADAETTVITVKPSIVASPSDGAL